MTSKQSNQRCFLACIAFLVMTLVLCFGLWNMDPVGTFRQLMTYSFASTVGRVIQCDWAPDKKTAVLRYSYTVAGRQFQGTCFSKRSVGAQLEFGTIFKDKSPGDAVTVYYDAAAPADSVLFRGLSISGEIYASWIGGAALVWIIFATVCLPLIFSRNNSLQELQQEVVDDGRTQRIRIVPGGLTPFWSVVFSVVFVGLFIGGGLWIAGVMEYWDISPAAAVAIGMLSGIAVGLLDHNHTVQGNARGRWDLIVDRDRGTLQLPAFGPYGEPTTFEIDAVLGVSAEPASGPYGSDAETSLGCALVVTYRGHAVDRTRRFRCDLRWNQANSLAEWIRQSIGLV